MVVTREPATLTASVVHDFTATPSTSTRQAPHCEVSQPTWVPVSPSFSRSISTRRVRSSTSADAALPLTVISTTDKRDLPSRLTQYDDGSDDNDEGEKLPHRRPAE